jgi:hypothetical protein
MEYNAILIDSEKKEISGIFIECFDDMVELIDRDITVVYEWNNGDMILGDSEEFDQDESEDEFLFIIPEYGLPIPGKGI